jgi:hypothetical protein
LKLIYFEKLFFADGRNKTELKINPKITGVLNNKFSLKVNSRGAWEQSKTMSDFKYNLNASTTILMAVFIIGLFTGIIISVAF